MTVREKYLLKDYPNLKGEVKVAILFKVLGQDLALTMFRGKITEDKLLKVKNRSKRIEYVAPALQRMIVEQYYNSLLAFDSTTAINTKDGVDNVSDKKREIVYNQIFNFLVDLTSEQVYYLIKEEKPSVQAIVIEQLEASDRMDVLRKLDRKIRKKVMIEISEINNIPLDAVITLANELEKNSQKLADPTEFKRGGKNSVEDILRELPESEAVEFLKEIEKDNPALHGQVKKAIFTFDHLVTGPPETCEKIWSAIIEHEDVDITKTPNIISLAFKGIEDEDYERCIISLLTERQKAMYDQLSDTPVAKAEVMKARGQIRNVAYELVSKDAFNVDDIFEADMID
jgi:flagellar motor switch protein FliG